MNAKTEALQLQGAAGLIEALLDRPADTPPKGTAVISHPHPLFGGTMQNKVVQTLARAFVLAGWNAVRYNFRGVGASAGTHDDGRGELEDLLQVIQQAARKARWHWPAFPLVPLSRPMPWRVSRPPPRPASRSSWSWSARPPAASRLTRWHLTGMPAPWWCMAKKTMSFRWPPSWTGRARSHFLSPLFPASATSFTDNCRC